MRRSQRRHAKQAKRDGAACLQDCVSLLVVGDIHGHLDKLTRLWGNAEERMGAERFAKAGIVFLGDFVDRGPDSKGVIEFLANLHKTHPHQKHVFLAGNHDLGLCAFLGLAPFDDVKGLAEKTAASFKSWRGDSLFPGYNKYDMHLQGARLAGQQAEDPTDSVFEC